MANVLRGVSSNLPGDLIGGRGAYLKYFIGQREVVEKIIEIVGGVIC